eukprot:TRINITY_DN43411_c0_g1_i1.p1 TRINITY_DN43411_c0_g1~~TRINITY_DN43411_c0_g1_i1.p1  ORF type:complete len:668 (+),score=174.18 TRINITY_DN43411_c0_g1_i1:56-2005(+)
MATPGPKLCGCGSTHGKDPRVPPYGVATPQRSASSQREVSPRAPRDQHRVPARFITRIEAAAEAEELGEGTCEAPTLGPRLLHSLQAGRKWAQTVAWVHHGPDCVQHADFGCSELLTDLEALGYASPQVLRREEGAALSPPYVRTLLVSLAEAAAHLRSPAGADCRAFSAPVSQRRVVQMQCDFSTSLGTVPLDGSVVYERCVPTERVAERLRAADSLLTETAAAEERWRALAWFYALDDPGSGVVCAHEACSWAMRTDAEDMGHWGRLCQALLAEDPGLGFCSPTSARPSVPGRVWRALLMPWGGEAACLQRYRKGRRVLWSTWTLTTTKASFAAGFHTPLPGELVPLVLHLDVPAYDPIHFRIWDLSVASGSPDLEEVLLAPWTVVVPDDDPVEESGVWHVHLRAVEQLLTDGDFVVATLVLRAAGFEDDEGRLVARTAWYSTMPQWQYLSSTRRVWKAIPGCGRTLALFTDAGGAAEWMREASKRCEGGVAFRVLADEAPGAKLLRDYYFGRTEAVAPVEAMLMLPPGASGLSEPLADLGAVQVATSQEHTVHFLRRPYYSIGSGEWMQLADTPPPPMQALWYCWRRWGSAGVVYGDVQSVSRWRSDSVAPMPDEVQDELIHLDCSEAADWDEAVRQHKIPIRPFD